MVQPLAAMLRIPIDQVQAGPNARGDVGDITDLALSIRTLGMQKPLLVCQIDDARFEVLDGHRRLAAARHIGLPHVDAVLRRPPDASLRLKQQLAMNAHAKAFDPIAEATALHALMWQHNMSREEIARAVGRSPAWVRDRIGLLQLADGERQAVAAGRMSVREAQLIVTGRRAAAAGDETRAAARAQPTANKGGRHRRARRHCDTCTCEVG